MGVKHQMVSESKSLCGRLVTQGTGADCKSCVRVRASKDAWAGKPAADMVAVATDVPGEAEYVTREQFAAQVAEAKRPRAKSATPKVTKVAELDASDIAEGIAQAWVEAGSPRDGQGKPDISRLLTGSEVQAGETAAQATDPRQARIDTEAREAFELSKVDAAEQACAEEFADRLHDDLGTRMCTDADCIHEDHTPGCIYPCHDAETCVPTCVNFKPPTCDEEAWHGTDTCLAHPDRVLRFPRPETGRRRRVGGLTQAARTGLGRRKRKATKRARKLAQGVKGGK